MNQPVIPQPQPGRRDHSESGAIPITLILYAVGAAAALGFGWWVWDTWTSGRAAKVEVRFAMAELDCRETLIACIQTQKAALVDCRQKYQASLDAISLQNAAVAKLRGQAQAAQKRAKEALAQAEQGSVASQPERARLQALRDAGEPSCMAAVAQVRSGLRP